MNYFLKRNRLFIFFWLSILLFIFLTSEDLIGKDSKRIYLSYNRDYNSLINKNLFLNIECHSGTPPILEFVLKDSDKIVKQVLFDFEGDGEIDLKIDHIINEVLFRGVPYKKSGTYTAYVYLDTAHGIFMREFIISFTEFIWGRDNFNFANDGKFEDAIDSVSNTVIGWAQQRFGPCTQEEKVLLLSIMYEIYRGSIGRCYGFSGGVVYYINHPDCIPFPYDSVYAIDEKDIRIIRFLDFLQNDIFFANLISGRIDLYKRQDTKSLKEEMNRIRKSINSGKPMIVVFLNNEMHFSMVVFGYFENIYRNRITLLAASSWERNQEINSFSENAQNIVINLVKNNHAIIWYDLTTRRYRYPDKIVAVDVEEKYSFRQEDFISLLEQIKDELLQKDKILIMVEKTENAYVADKEGRRKGYEKPIILNELDDVSFRRVDYNYIFEIPKSREYSLILKKRRYNKEQRRYKEVNIYGIIPQNGIIKTFMINNVPMEEGAEKVFIINNDGIIENEEQLCFDHTYLIFNKANFKL